MNRAFILLATAISIVPALAGADSGPLTALRSLTMDRAGDPDSPIFTDVPGIGLAVPTRGDAWGEPARVAFDPEAPLASPGLHLSMLSILYSSTPQPTPLPRPAAGPDSMAPDEVNPSVAEPFSVLLAGVGVMGLIAQRKSRLRLALAR